MKTQSDHKCKRCGAEFNEHEVMPGDRCPNCGRKGEYSDFFCDACQTYDKSECIHGDQS